NWARLSAGQSGIHRLTRFPITGLRTTIGGSVDFMALDPLNAAALSRAMAREAALEALAQSGIADERDGKRRFPGELFLAAPPVEHEWPQRFGLARQHPGGARSYDELA